MNTDATVRALKVNCPFKPAQTLLSVILGTEHKLNTYILVNLKTDLKKRKKKEKKSSLIRGNSQNTKYMKIFTETNTRS